MHWVIAHIVVFFYLLVLQMFASGLQGSIQDHMVAMWDKYAPLALVAVTFFPVFVYDVIRLSHRFAGPIVSLKKNLRDMAKGEEVAPLRFRNNDFWKNLTEDMNSIAKRLNLTKAETTE
jgi:signal transduction histidine kinase